MRFGSLFSGIEAASVAWQSLGWECAWVAEIDPFCRAALTHHYPKVPNLGDVECVDPAAIEPVDLIVFGSPCQGFSVAGKRGGLDDPRSKLVIVALDLVARLRPRWVVFENVPGLLSNWSGGEDCGPDPGDGWEGPEASDFAAFLGAVRERGYLGCWRSLDAQFAGLAQRRERVFFVGHLGDWRPAAAVLFEPESLRGNSAPGRETGQGVAASLTHGVDSGGRGGYAGRRREDDSNLTIGFGAGGDAGDAGDAGDDLAPTLAVNSGRGHGSSSAVAFGGNKQSGEIDIATAVNAHGGPHGRLDFESETFICGTINANGKAAGSATQQDAETGMLVTHSLRADGFDASEDGTGRGTPLIPIQNATRGQDQNGLGVGGEAMFTLDSASQHAIAFQSKASASNSMNPSEVTPSLDVGKSDGIAVAFQEAQTGVREYAEAGSLRANGPGHDPVGTRIREGMLVRRLTPTECERLQGFPDGYTAIPYRGKLATDGPRYRALGNSMAVPVMRWIGERIALVTSVMD